MPLLSLKFGAGLNSRVALQDVGDIEAAHGENFDIIPGDSRLNWRKPFDRVATCPVGLPINGYAAWTDVSGASHILIQSGPYVWAWDGATTWTGLYEVPAGAQLRGSQASYYAVLDGVFIADVAGVSPVLAANGSAIWAPTFVRGVPPMAT